MGSEASSFDEVKARLDEIVEQISEDGISLDESLALYEEAVRLGLEACDLSETDVLPPDEAEGAPEGAAEASSADALPTDVPSADGPLTDAPSTDVLSNDGRTDEPQA